MNGDSEGSAARRGAFLREPQWVITIAAVLASVGALVIGSYEAVLQREHDRASMWPHLELGITFTPKTSGMQVSNSGVGPAIVQSVLVSVDGRPTMSWPEVFTALFGAPAREYNNSSVGDRVIRAGETVDWFELPTKSLPPDIQTRVARAAIEICYASVYGEHWVVADSHAGQRSVWHEVNRCPEPGARRSEF